MAGKSTSAARRKGVVADLQVRLLGPVEVMRNGPFRVTATVRREDDE